MEALRFHHDVPRYLATRVAARVRPGAWIPALSPLRATDLPLPEPPGPDWTRLDVTLSGICGSDVKMLTGEDSLFLEPEATYPFVPGHELVGTVGTDLERTPYAEGIAAGTRVAVWPVLGCRVRGWDDLCPACREGWDGQCERRDEGWPGRGITVGYNRDTGGGWAEACLAHRSQLHPLPARVTDEDAVLLDPGATALASLLREGATAERTLVIGGGTIGLLTGLLHRGLRLPGECRLLVRHEHQLRWARDHGLAADRVATADAFADWASRHGFGSRRVPTYGLVHRGTFDRVIDAAGTRTSLRWAMASVRPRGVVVLPSSGGDLRGIDPTPLWYREITWRGINVYGPVPWEGESRHPFAVLLPPLARGDLVLRDLVTHRFSLADHDRAFRAALDRKGSGCLKAILSPGGKGANR